jgi:hypothetical protein
MSVSCFDFIKINEYIKKFTYIEEEELFQNNTSNQGQTIVEEINIDGEKYPVFINEFWTSKQRQASPLHEIAYRACFKPQLPRFFII